MFAEDVLHVRNLPGPEQGTIKNSMRDDRPTVIFIGELEPPRFNSIVPAGVNEGHIIGSLGRDEEAMAEIEAARVAARRFFPEGQSCINSQYPLGIGLPFP
jgi:hypothetical protein